MLGITMRVVKALYDSGAVERRDALAQDWQPFLARAFPDQAVLPLPNAGANITKTLKQLPFTGFIFSGGNDWGEAPERDLTERCILDYAKTRGLPIFGVCRGLQALNILMGGALSPMAGHCGAPHNARWRDGHCGQVNSFHRQGILTGGLAHGLVACAWADDGTVEAAASADGLIQGVMWHPERGERARDGDIELMRACLIRNEP